MIKEKVLIMNYDKAMYMKFSINKSNSSDFLLNITLINIWNVVLKIEIK